MDELPSEAKSILTLAKGAQPKAAPGARERVRVGVDAALAGTVAAGHGRDTSNGLGEVGNGKALFTTSKIMLASTVLLIGGGSMLWGRRTPDVAQPRTPASEEIAANHAPAPVEPRPLVAAGQASAATEPNEEPTQANARTHEQRVAQHASEQRFALAAEMSLLSDATNALAAHDTSRARTLLLEHKKRFRNAQLREEREGLWVLVRCLEEPAGAQGEAATFVRKSPNSILATRVKRACGLGDGT